MIKREAQLEIINLLNEFPAVCVLGTRQVGKTTLAEEIAALMKPDPIYLDLESPAGLARLSEPEDYFELHKGKLIILDEIQRVPELFQILRVVIDRRRHEGMKAGQFLIPGSASLDLLKQSSETLAGRIAYKELHGLTASEIATKDQGEINRLWLRGGFPDSFLAKTDEASLRWRQNFISTYLEREVPQFGARIPAVTLRRLWTMLAHSQGGQLNIGKRLVKAPKIYIRDSGLTHALLNLTTLDDVLGHPVVGSSWEGLVMENLLSCLPIGVTPWFYRTSAGAEIDLVIEQNNKKKYAIEIKRSMSPSLSKGFHLGCEDIKATHRYIIYPGKERFPVTKEVSAISILDMMKELRGMK